MCVCNLVGNYSTRTVTIKCLSFATFCHCSEPVSLNFLRVAVCLSNLWLYIELTTFILTCFFTPQFLLQVQYKEAEGSSFRDGSYGETPGTPKVRNSYFPSIVLGLQFGNYWNTCFLVVIRIAHLFPTLWILEVIYSIHFVRICYLIFYKIKEIIYLILNISIKL